MVCKQETTYRKLVLEDLNDINSREFNQTIKTMYNEIMKVKDLNHDKKQG